ncbi:hypothetical protein IFM61606_07966 [Aspergillus udagawae]|uniref:Rhodopsin domain-containing protein n=1 Tax=Aspergillus udagawae TaxID=91492 RepID=A0ABQ0ZYW6_9EURO|nr:hypothetical protein IFM51744_04077 [Aspergillus udagawae]GFF69523.1 hypothetical protein IFM53868_00075 [Aspergillus udagawae]GFG21001.1 hypothetical protein IFM5058_10874 [Aspergillus udagawae]GFG27900.1 hypothetical protein IFM61606_07966 [Aspergillus udagawae]
MDSYQSMLNTRGIYSETPPDIRTRLDDHPTLLVSWWATGFSLAFIITRVCGRYIRTERFFPEDKMMMASVIPLLIRMALVHVVLLYGTNNTKTAGLTEEEIRQREIGSRLVLAARIFYAIFIWIAKFTVCEFLKRVAGMIWQRSLRIFIKIIYYFLASTLIAVLIATLVECQPFDHYWQVVPDPGPQCRLGYANLITMGACDIVTDLLLVAYPIPIVLMTHMPMKRKVILAVLFALSLILVGITCYRVPSVIWHHGSQQYRSLLASLEILAATAVSNAVVIGSFVRDKGVKKAKFKKAVGSASVSESMDHSSTRRATITYHQWGSDSDLAGDLGIRLTADLHSSDNKVPRPAPVAVPYHPITAQMGTLTPNWSFGNQRHSMGTDDDITSTTGSLELKVSPLEYIETNKTHHKKSNDVALSSPSKVSIFDVGGLLDDSPTPGSLNSSAESTRHRELSYGSQQYRNGSRAFLQDVGGLLPPNTRNGRRRGSSVHFSDTADPPVPPYHSQQDTHAPILERSDEVELQDVGGLLSRDT